eukprot:3222117-Pyramimonas_sp.AAC.1
MSRDEFIRRVESCALNIVNLVVPEFVQSVKRHFVGVLTFRDCPYEGACVCATDYFVTETNRLCG